MDSKLYRRVVETMIEGVAVQNADGELIYVNDALAELAGRCGSEMVGRLSQEFIAPDLREDFGQQLTMRRKGAAEPYETRILHENGSEVPVRISPQPLYERHGEFVGSFAVVSKIGDIKRGELERDVISAIVRGVVETANLDELLALIHGALGRVIYAENCFVALLDEASDTIYFPYFVDQYDKVQEPIRRGKTCTDYVLRTGRPLLLTQQLFEDLVARGEVELVGPSSPSWMGVPLVTPSRTIGVLAVQHYQDVGAYSERDLEFFGSVGGHIALAIERKRAEERLHASEELYTNVVQSMSDGVVVLDCDFHFLHWNDAMESLSKTPRELVLRNGQRPWELFPHLIGLGVDRMMKQAMVGELQKAENLEHVLPDGTRRITNETYRPLRGAGGEIRGVVGVVRDVTGKKIAEEALHKSEEQLRQAQKMEAIGRLAGGIAHDFNNLLTAINGYSELITASLSAEDPITPQVLEIRRAGEHASNLTRQLLAFSRKQVVQPRVVDLNTQVKDLEGMLNRLIGEDIELETRLDPGLGRIKTDPGQIEQILINLVVNARDAMPTGGKISIRTADRDLDSSCADHVVIAGHYVGIEVTDTGIGMAPEVRARVFEPFFTTKEKGKGTGMGLSTVYGIVKQNGGYIWVDSREGAGATFTVYLPRTEEPLSSARPRGPLEDALEGSETVLVVEDEAAVRTLTRTILSRHGYRVLEAGDAQEALRTCAADGDCPDLLISDVVMPQMSGPQLVKLLHEEHPDLRVLFISGHPDETLLQHGALREDIEILLKPFKVGELLTRVRRILGERTDRAL